MDITTNIVIGVISGILSTATIYFAAVIFNASVLPWLRGLIYKGVNVTGTWYCHDRTMTQEITLNLVQNAHAITGSASFIGDTGEHLRRHPEYETLRTFSVTGEIQDRFIYLTLRNSDAQRLGVNTYLLEVKGDGRRLDGVFTFYSVSHSHISHSYQTLYKDKALAESNAKAREGQPDKEAAKRISKTKSAPVAVG